MMKKRLTYKDCLEFLDGERLPAAFVDLDAFDSNLDVILRKMEGSGKTLRIASKSVRCLALLKRLRQKGGDTVRGIMAYTVEEAAYQYENGLDDILVAYPSVQDSDMKLLAELTARGADVSLIADCEEHIRAMGAAGRAAGVELQAVVEVDMSYRPLGDAFIVGVRRSPIRDGASVLKLARLAGSVGGVKVVGIMGYEAQIAGLTDRNPFTKGLNPIKKMLRELSRPDVVKLRSGVVKHLAKHGHELRIVNGGGTGSVDSTGRDDSCTEVTAGSGFYCSHLFSYYSNIRLTPAAFFALQVVRVPSKDMVTCAGGGYIASGEIGADRLPVPYLPRGGKLLDIEGAGEVQTPVVFEGGAKPGIGQPVIFRHSKAGELCERFNELLLVKDNKIVDRVPTYRGDGQCYM